MKKVFLKFLSRIGLYFENRVPNKRNYKKIFLILINLFLWLLLTCNLFRYVCFLYSLCIISKEKKKSYSSKKPEKELKQRI